MDLAFIDHAKNMTLLVNGLFLFDSDGLGPTFEFII
jgi:hypothetical protein